MHLDNLYIFNDQINSDHNDYQRYFSDFIPPTKKKAVPHINCALCCLKKEIKSKK